MPRGRQNKGGPDLTEGASKLNAVVSKPSDHLNDDNEIDPGEDDNDDISDPIKSFEDIIAEQNKKINMLHSTVGMLCDQGGYNPQYDFDFEDSQSNNSNSGDIQSILQNNDDNTIEEKEEDIDPAVKQLLDDLQQPNDFGPNVNTITAQAFQAIPAYQLNKETQDKWKTEYKIPENCPNLSVPMVNGEIWNHLPLPAKTSDAKYQAMQQNLVRSLVAQTRAMDLIMKDVPKTAVPLILKPQLDSAKLISVAIQDINQRRKNNLKSFMRPEYRSLCSAKLPVSKYLFGDNLEQSMKSVRATSNIVRGPNEPFRRFHPYRQGGAPRTAQSLNYNRPPQMPFYRGGGQFRGQRFPQRGGQPRWNTKFRQ